MTEMVAYNFTCDVPDVAPVGKLTVRLYKGDTIIHTQKFNHSSKEPMNQSSTISFIPSRRDNNATFKCEVILDLEPVGPKLREVSNLYTIKVQCKLFFFPPITLIYWIFLVFTNASPLFRWTCGPVC